MSSAAEIKLDAFCLLLKYSSYVVLSVHSPGSALSEWKVKDLNLYLFWKKSYFNVAYVHMTLS